MDYSSPTVYAPPIGKAHYRHFVAPDEWLDKMKLIIGRAGCNFIKATRRSGCSYIWYHKDTHLIEIWGPFDKIMKGENCVRKIAQKYLDIKSNDQ
mgnify:FL=1